jgi:alanine-synthesizing transaminase
LESSCSKTLVHSGPVADSHFSIRSGTLPEHSYSEFCQLRWLFGLIIRSSKRVTHIESAIRETAARADALEQEGKRIINLNIGDPVRYGFETPVHIRKAMESAIENGNNNYSPAQGLRELREAISEKEKRINRIELDPEDVMVTAGISEAIQFIMAALLDPGSEVLLPGPCYPPYAGYANLYEGTPKTYRTIEAEGWNIDVEDLEASISKRTRLIVLINPSNPCGSVYSKHTLTQVLDIAASHNLPVAVDEIYDQIVYDDTFTSLASISSDVPIIGLNGFSKAHLMTGWRLGYLYLHDPNEELKDIWNGMQRLARLRLCPNTPVQLAAIQALRGPQDHIRDMVETLRARRNYAWKKVNEIRGLSASNPSGAFYLFPRIVLDNNWSNDYEFVSRLMSETGVVTVHGSGFDSNYGKDHFRMIFLPREDELSEALERIDGFMRGRSPAPDSFS